MVFGIKTLPAVCLILEMSCLIYFCRHAVLSCCGDPISPWNPLKSTDPYLLSTFACI